MSKEAPGADVNNADVKLNRLMGELLGARLDNDVERIRELRAAIAALKQTPGAQALRERTMRVDTGENE